MRRSASLLIPLAIITAWYAFWVFATYFMLTKVPVLQEYFPIGGTKDVLDIAASEEDFFEPVYTSVQRNLFSSVGPVKLAFSTLGAIILTIPVSWAYFITSRARRINQSFLQTIIILPIVVAGISMIVLNSLALAFSLAGVVAAVRFRFALNQPSDAMYIFVSIAIGLGCGIGAVGVVAVTSYAFVITTLVIWKLEYGKTLAGPFLTMVTRRDKGEDDYD